jgi:outer membrane receptor for ferrienterochelin and colicins
MQTFRLSASVLASCTALGASAALGQSAPDASAVSQTVVVSATRHAMALIDAPAVLGVVTQQQIQERGADNLFEALRGETGLSLIGRTISGRRNISVRGMDGRHTLFLVDGRRIGNSDGVIGHSDFQYDWVAMEEVERVEVVRGPMSVLYGAEALGGVVNVITRAPGDRWGFRGTVEGARADGGFGGSGHRVAAHVGGPLGQGLRLAATLSEGRRSEVLSKADPRIGDLEGRHKVDGSLQLGWDASSTQQLQLEHRQGLEDRWAGMKERSGQRRFFQSASVVDRRHTALTWTADWATDATLHSTVRAYGSRVGMTNVRSNGVAGLRPNLLIDHVLDAQLTADHRSGWVITGGGEWRDERLRNDGLPGGEGSATHQALFAHVEAALSPHLALTGGLRADHHQRFGSEWSPRLYAVWKPAAHWVVKGGYGHGFKAPTLKQITPDYQEDEGPNTFIGNAALVPERNDGLEASLGYDTERVGVEATVFHNRVRQLIVPVLFNTVAGRGQYRFDNLDQATFRGAELSTRAALPAGFGVQVQLTYLDATDGHGQRLEKRPRLLAGAELNWGQGPWRAGVRVDHHRGQLIASTTVGQPAQPLPNLTRLSAFAHWRVDARWTVDAGVDNLSQLRLADESPLFTWAETPRTWRLALRNVF